jgi:hypothetical protein
MRKFILLAGTALTLSATPAAACDLELMIGGPQRFNAFAAYAGAGHAPAPVATEVAEAQSEQPSNPEPAPPSAPAEVSSDWAANPDNGAPDPSATFR